MGYTTTRKAQHRTKKIYGKQWTKKFTTTKQVHVNSAVSELKRRGYKSRVYFRPDIKKWYVFSRKK